MALPITEADTSVKSEDDDLLGQIGGMTSLVVVRGPTSASSSVVEASPQTPNSLPPTIAPAPTRYMPVLDSPPPSSTWEYPSHMQPNSLNMPMDIYHDSFSLNVDMVPDGSTDGSISPAEMKLYGQQHQPHLGPSIQQQLPPHLHPPGSYDISGGMGMGHLPSAPQYYATLFGGSMTGLYGQHHIFSGHETIMRPSNNMQCIPHNPQESWQNFEAQYKS
jgi:hypothetical protein